MKTLISYINEATNVKTPAVQQFYRVNIGKNNNKSYPDIIGDIEELSYKYYSEYIKDENGKDIAGFVFGKPTQNGKNWTFALGVKTFDIDSTKNFKKFIDTYNKTNKFYQICEKLSEAEKLATKYKKQYDTKKWTLNSLLKAILNDKDLMSLKYDYKIADISNQISTLKTKSIYVSGVWRIRIEDNKILVDRAGWKTYEVPNLQSLYKVLAANSGSDNDETIRCEYSITK